MMVRFKAPNEVRFNAVPEKTIRDVVLASLELEDARVADIGAGRGANALMMAKYGARVLAVEPNMEALRHLKTDGLPVTPVLGEADTVDLPPQGLDIVTFFKSLHHIPYRRIAASLAHAHAALRRGGVMFIVEPISAGPMYQVMRIVDDESAVQQTALKTLTTWLGKVRATKVDETIFRLQATYPDFSAFKNNLVEVDPSRQQAVEANWRKMATLFEQNATPSPRGLVLHSLNRAIRIAF